MNELHLPENVGKKKERVFRTRVDTQSLMVTVTPSLHSNAAFAQELRKHLVRPLIACMGSAVDISSGKALPASMMELSTASTEHRHHHNNSFS